MASRKNAALRYWQRHRRTKSALLSEKEQTFGSPSWTELLQMCRQVADAAVDWNGQSGLYDSVVVFREVGAKCRRLIEQALQSGSADRSLFCDCELPGYFYSGVPGILARLEKGVVAPGADVQRCDLCLRYPSDEAAAQKLIDLGLS